MKKKHTKSFLCVWTSGHETPVPVYYRENDEGHWGATLDRAEAKRFASRRAAWQAWKSKHVAPEQYEPAIQAGRIRVEDERQPYFCFER